MAGGSTGASDVGITTGAKEGEIDGAKVGSTVGANVVMGLTIGAVDATAWAKLVALFAIAVSRRIVVNEPDNTA